MPEASAPASATVYLTFDDGPADPFTARILDSLRQHQAAATFFVCGANVARHPALARRIVAEGHAIGNHTYSHNKVRGFLGIWGSEIEDTRRLIREVTGAETCLFRPPWGFSRPWLSRIVRKTGYRQFLWDVWARDWEGPGAETIVDRVMRGIQPGSIILLHDGEKALPATDRSQTVKALPQILTALKERGLSFGLLAKGD